MTHSGKISSIDSSLMLRCPQKIFWTMLSSSIREACSSLTSPKWSTKTYPPRDEQGLFKTFEELPAFILKQDVSIPSVITCYPHCMASIFDFVPEASPVTCHLWKKTGRLPVTSVRYMREAVWVYGEEKWRLCSGSNKIRKEWSNLRVSKTAKAKQ